MTETEKAPMTIKGVPIATRQTMIACASKRGQTMANWLVRAVENQANLEAGDQVNPAKFEPQTLPGLPETAPGFPPGKLTVTELQNVMEASAAVAAASGVPVPKATARHAYALLTTRLREARGLPPLARRLPRGQTLIENGQTIEG